SPVERMRRKDSRVGLDLSDELLQVSTSYKQSGPLSAIG
ncbi:MAG: hypothetical protein K0S78_5004, partial [Thermomicrobiales bacterium]|nr:hypothetical protein [Thermomicrobiales bacterium]